MLTNFELARPFLTNEFTRKHVRKERNIEFRGNKAFSSRNAFKQVTLSRRDDLISLCYNLVYFLHEGQDEHARLIRDGHPQLNKKLGMLRKS